jgi:TRAP-type C4-dicarboxylate transport system permease small subunit
VTFGEEASVSRSAILHKLVNTIIIGSLAVIVFSMILQVVARYFFHAALPWPEELSQFLLVILSFLGMYRAIGEDMHIRLDILPRDGGSGVVRLLQAGGLLAAAAFVGYIGYGGLELARNAWSQPSPAMRLPMGLFYLVIPVACLLSLLAFLARIHLILPRGDGR